MMWTEKKIEEAIIRHSNIPVKTLEEETALCDLGYDSFTRTQLILDLEQEQGFEFPLEKLHPDNFLTVAAVKETVKSVIQDAGK